MGEKLRQWELCLNNYDRALHRLAEIVNECTTHKLNDSERTSVAKRFESSFECARMLMRSYAESLGLQEAAASHDSIRQAQTLHTIEDCDTWMSMGKRMDETVYNHIGTINDDTIKEIARKFYPTMAAYYNTMKALAMRPQHFMFY